MAKTEQLIEDQLKAELEGATEGAEWKREYPVCAERNWRFDLALPELKIAVELEGRHHHRQARHRTDCEKQNYATAQGWRVFRYPTDKVKAKCRRVLIVEQLHRVVCGVSIPELDVDLLTGSMT